MLFPLLTVIILRGKNNKINNLAIIGFLVDYYYYHYYHHHHYYNSQIENKGIHTL